MAGLFSLEQRLPHLKQIGIVKQFSALFQNLKIRNSGLHFAAYENFILSRNEPNVRQSMSLFTD